MRVLVRAKSEQHYYNAKHQRLLDLGLEPRALGNTLIDDVVGGVVEHRAARVRAETLAAVVDWRRGGSLYTGSRGPARPEGDVGVSPGAVRCCR